MAKCLLGGDTHHELLIFEGLLALTNISSCINAHSTDFGLGTPLTYLPCGAKKGLDGNTRPLYNILVREFLFEPNSKIQVAVCELLSNLSLTPEIQAMAAQTDEESDSTESF